MDDTKLTTAPTDKIFSISGIAQAKMSFDICIESPTHSYKYNPKPDITVYELARIMQLFMVVSFPHKGIFGTYFNPEDILEFLGSHYNCLRHFDMTKK